MSLSVQERQLRDLKLLNRVSVLIMHAADGESIIEQVCPIIRETLGVAFAGIVLLDERSARVLHCEFDTELPITERMTLEAGASIPDGGVISRIRESREPVRIDDARSDDDDPFRMADNIRSLVAAPLLIKGHVTGVIVAQHTATNHFIREDEKLLQNLAGYLAQWVAKARQSAASQRLRDDLSQMIVHDLRNPIQNIQMTLQEILSRAELSAVVTEAVKDGLRAGDELLDMVSDLLDVARFEAGQIALEISAAAIHDHVRAIASRFEVQARRKKIAIELELSDDVSVTYIDQDLVRRALTNLLANALRFAPEGSAIVVSSRWLPDGDASRDVNRAAVLLSVRDQGEGVPESFHEKIFDKFGQVESSRDGLVRSTGLGLTLCRFVAEAHDGAIWVECPEEGGATFHMLIGARMQR